MSPKKWKWIYGIAIGFLTILMIGLYVLDFLNDKDMKIADIIIWIVIIFAWFQFATWGNDSKAKNDEMGQQIRNESAKISYYILMYALFFLWVADVFVNNSLEELGNPFLFAGMCLSIILYPIVQYIVSKRYTK